MWYLKSAFDTYQKVQETVQSRLTEVQSAIFSPVDMMKRFLGGAAASPPQAETDSELEALRKRVADLESRRRKVQSGKHRSRKSR